MLRIFEAGDLAGAHAHFVQAGKVGARFAHRDLVTLARIGEGRMLIYLGDIAEGMALLDEAMVSIEAGELSPLATGDAYCTVIDACAELFDLGRCRSWTDSFVRWCDTQQELVLYRGHCFLHRAEVLGLLGAWPKPSSRLDTPAIGSPHPSIPPRWPAPAPSRATSSASPATSTAPRPPTERASEYGHDPQPGLALLRLAQGRLDAADAMIRRVLDEAQDPISRARLLGPYVEIVLTTGDTPPPAALPTSSAASRPTLGTPLLRAHAARAAGAVLWPKATPRQRSSSCGRAFNEFHALGVRYDAARTRLLIAEACAALGDHDAAAMESSAAPRRARLARRGDPEHDRRAGTTSSPDGLTQRELEVLGLLARGKTNRVIAQELVISEKTVASHVSHIFTKLGVTSRSAATAYAYDHHLVE